jgi:hypothetical protein
MGLGALSRAVHAWASGCLMGPDYAGIQTPPFFISCSENPFQLAAGVARCWALQACAGVAAPTLLSGPWYSVLGLVIGVFFSLPLRRLAAQLYCKGRSTQVRPRNDQVRPAVPYTTRPSRWRAAPADTAESADMQPHTAPVDREAATQIENGCYPEPEKLLR